MNERGGGEIYAQVLCWSKVDHRPWHTGRINSPSDFPSNPPSIPTSPPLSIASSSSLLPLPTIVSSRCCRCNPWWEYNALLFITREFNYHFIDLLARRQWHARKLGKWTVLSTCPSRYWLVHFVLSTESFLYVLPSLSSRLSLTLAIQFSVFIGRNSIQR